MLPPVQISQSATVYPQARPTALSTQGTVPAPQAGERSVPSGLELSAAIAGRLNILLLAGAERSAEGFTILSDLLGKSLGITRKEGETQTNFMRRLAEVLVALPPSRRAIMERQFAELFKGLALQTLIAALSDPSGPQASKVAMWLDSQQDTRRDPATSSVITSYRQNDTEGMPTVLAGRQAAPATVAAANPIATTVASTGGSGISPPPTNVVAATLPNPAAAVDAPASGQMPPSAPPQLAPAAQTAVGQLGATSGTAVRVETPVPASATMPLPVQPASDPQTDRSIPAADMALVADSETDNVDARTLQLKLSDAFRTAAGPGDRPTDSVLARTAAPMARSEGTNQFPLETATLETVDEPRRDTLFVLKGWQHVETLPPIDTPVDADDAIGKLLRAGLLMHRSSEDQRPLDAEIAASEVTSNEPIEARQDRSSLATKSEAESEASTLPRPSAEPLGRSDLAVTRAPVEADVTPASTAPATRDGIAIPVVNYLFASDEEIEDDPSRREAKDERTDERSDDTGDESRPEDEPRDEGSDDDSHNDEFLAAANEGGEPEAAEPRLTSPNGVSERANELYWRMAGWA